MFTLNVNIIYCKSGLKIKNKKTYSGARSRTLTLLSLHVLDLKRSCLCDKNSNIKTNVALQCHIVQKIQ